MGLLAGVWGELKGGLQVGFWRVGIFTGRRGAAGDAFLLDSLPVDVEQDGVFVAPIGAALLPLFFFVQF